MRAINKKKLPVTWRLTILNAFTMFSLLVLFAAGLIFSFYLEISETKSKKLESTVSYLENAAAKEALTDAFLKGVRLKGGLKFAVYADSGAGIFIADDYLFTPHLNNMSSNIRFVTEREEDGEAEEFEYIIESGKWVKSGNQKVYIHVYSDVTDEMEIVEKIPVIFLATIGFGLIVCFFAGRFMSRRMLKPVKEISSQMKSISANNLNERIKEPDTEDELHELAVSFNKMFERLEQAFLKQNRFVSDASHELRTPLAVLQGHASMLMRWGKEDKAVLENSLKTMQTEIHGMNELVEKLLLLAQSDDRAAPMQKETIPAREFLQEVIDEARLIAPDANIFISACEIVCLHANRPALKQVLRILLDNSIKYCPAPGKITMSAKPSGKGALITVKDEGPGIEKDKLPFIFDRFFRSDSSRTRKTGGAGLGLAIAKEIVQAHNGTISAESKTGHGAKILVWLPDS